MIYLSFSKEATEEIIPNMGEYEIPYQFCAKNDSDNNSIKTLGFSFSTVRTLLGAKLFHVGGGEPSSVLDLPGSVLIVPQDSLTGTLKNCKFQYLQRIDAFNGQWLYKIFVYQCEYTKIL